ncbi:hypothetical protein M407DRAFT_243647 [Tulasnella calospora MUT 4182]|uniref:Uncharacterized protein n=1 Tax=Tulasnella calospora MUT 4182 TaxID=1051891 RepID=A0A0C3LZ18_9AGAM|nr:hypothetical protein M407DRAFT_243647 [Tulasnella calospora MUT 4182]
MWWRPKPPENFPASDMHPLSPPTLYDTLLSCSRCVLQPYKSESRCQPGEQQRKGLKRR